MGQTLTSRPISQQSSFATLNSASSPFAPNQSQYQGYTTPVQAQPMPAQTTVSGMARPPITTGFRGYGGFSGGMSGRRQVMF